MPDSLKRFQQEFRRWVEALKAAKRLNADPDDLLAQLGDRIPETAQRQIGGALINGWLTTEKAPHRGYCVRESDRPGIGGGQYAVSHVGNGNIAPCWELYVQLADYARLRTIAEPRGLQVRLEDHLMDVTVWAGAELLLYVEDKLSEKGALSLLKKMRGYGETGFGLEDADKGNDPLRKAKYLFRANARPKYFALSAVGYESLFAVEYVGNDHQFRLIEVDEPLTAPLREAAAHGGVPPGWCTADGLALELERCASDRIWISPGTGKSAFNFYVPTDRGGDAIAIGVYESGEVWTDFAKLGSESAERLACALSPLGVILETNKQWGFWKATDGTFNLGNSDVVAIAQAVADALLNR